MKKIISTLFTILIISGLSYSQSYTNDKPAYVIFNKSGEMVPFSHMLKDISTAEVCLFGELHNDPISHWLQITLVKELHKIKGRDLVIGAEMWERDNQLLLDEMLEQNLIDGSSYMESSKLWPNVETDYLPILQYAKSNGLKFVATNIPRRYARLIYKKGVEYLDSLSPKAKEYLPPMPVHFNLEESIYKDMARPFPTDEEYEIQRSQGKTGRNAMTSGKPSNLVKAQAIKDASMGYYIVENIKRDGLVFHLNGELHSAHYTAIYYYINYYRPGTKTKTISIVKTDNVLEASENTLKRADYIIQVPKDMTVTYVERGF